jgi:hypothetical protein
MAGGCFGCGLVWLRVVLVTGCFGCGLVLLRVGFVAGWFGCGLGTLNVEQPNKQPPATFNFQLSIFNFQLFKTWKCKTNHLPLPP